MKTLRSTPYPLNQELDLSRNLCFSMLSRLFWYASLVHQWLTGYAAHHIQTLGECLKLRFPDALKSVNLDKRHLAINLQSLEPPGEPAKLPTICKARWWFVWAAVLKTTVCHSPLLSYRENVTHLGASRWSCYWLSGSRPGVSSFFGSYLRLWSKGSYRFAKYQGDFVQKHSKHRPERTVLSGVMAGSLSEGRGHSRIPGYCLRLLLIG